MELEPKCEPETGNAVENECGAGDNTDSAEVAASSSNAVFLLNESKNEVEASDQSKEVIDLSNGYVELAPIMENQASNSDCVFSQFQVIPNGNGASDESTVLAYAWNQQISTASSDMANATTMSYVSSNPYSQLQTTNSSSYINTSAIGWPRRAYYTTTLPNGHLSAGQTILLAANRSLSNEDNAAIFARKNIVPLSDVLKDRQYTPSHASRQSHNEKERKRRSRMKHSCDMLRKLIPGVSEKTDKATVLEHTVKYLMHLQRCVSVKCNDYIPEMSRTDTPKLQFISTPMRFEPSMQMEGDAQLEENHFFQVQHSEVEREEDKENEQPIEAETTN
ncbi:transcription factor NAI1-like protein [Leptotrombidium deliense]|uniref:Transcription factor NAI1-like protein n=1 Tax=Leptotrombidium deliense TaxID=299467 RepID=A0A443SGM5_9ACAR|nr:transcription factor NAI1-like protein [Leptotrombidium deliense]